MIFEIMGEGNVTLPIGMDLQWSVTSENKLIKGILLRVGGGSDFDGTGALSSEEDNLSDATTCQAPAAGIGHTAELDTMVVVGTIRFDVEADVDVDITLVFENGGGVSDYAYEGYSVKFAAANTDISPTDMPAESGADGMGMGGGAGGTDATKSPAGAPSGTPVEDSPGGDGDDATESPAGMPSGTPVEDSPGGAGDNGQDGDDATESPAGGPSGTPVEDSPGGAGDDGPDSDIDDEDADSPASDMASPAPTPSAAPSGSETPSATAPAPVAQPSGGAERVPTQQDLEKDTSAAFVMRVMVSSLSLVLSALALIL